MKYPTFPLRFVAQRRPLSPGSHATGALHFRAAMMTYHGHVAWRTG